MKAFFPKAPRTLRSATVALAFCGLVASAMAPTTGCDTADEGPTCEGGYLTAAGACLPKCDPSKCREGNVCVENECRLQCAASAECRAGEQRCSATKDDAGASVQVCLANGHNVPSTGLGQGKPCPFGQSDCATTVCPNGLECDAGACGGKPALCVKDEAACAGQENCNIGACPDKTKTRCTVTTCDASECKALSCISSGELDATAFCTQTECSNDDQCGVGFYCGLVRDPHDICGETCTGGKCSSGSSCTKDSDCQKGNNNVCGTTQEPCLDLKAQPAGSSFQEGTLCLMHKQCLRRESCAPCKDNLDCANGKMDVCVTIGKSPACTHFCSADANCRADETCVPSGKSCTATPSIWCEKDTDCPEDNDTCAPRNVCVPRTGSCHAETATDSKFCFACTSDLDCGPVGSSWACSELGFGERACIDLSFPNACTKDADCPLSPGGKHGYCLNENAGVDPSNSVYHQCYFPGQVKQGQLLGFSCFP